MRNLLPPLFLLIARTASADIPPDPPLATAFPAPVLAFVSTTGYKASGAEFTRYSFTVKNLEEYPAELFAAAPDLPPCGNNAESSRTWVDLLTAGGKRLYGFCALQKPADLIGLWFALPAGEKPPAKVLVEFHDRKTGRRVRSGAVAPNAVSASKSKRPRS